MKPADNALRITLFMTALILFGFGIYLSVSDNVTSATATYAAGVFCLIFVYLSSFQSFEGLGIKAKLLDQKIEESEAVIKRLQKLLVLMASMLFSLSSRMGRLGSSLPRIDRYKLVEDIEGEFLLNGISVKEIDEAKVDWHRYNMIDLYSPIFHDLRKFSSQKNSILRSEFERKKSESEVSTQQSNNIEYAENKLKAAEKFQGDLEALIQNQEFELMPSKLRSLINSCIAISEEEKKDIFERLKEEFSDLDYYAKNHKFRRLDIWLNSKNQ